MKRREFSAALMATTGLASAALAQSAGQVRESGLVGELEGPTLVVDPARRPTRFSEAPMLAEQVRAGRLPPVEQRLPQDLMVIQPLRSVGRYGGTWRRGFIGPGDSENGNRIMSADKPFFFDKTGTEIAPCLCRGFELSDDGRRTIVHLRRGMRWSDGTPVEAYFVEKGAAKSQLALQHRKLGSRADAARLRTYWSERLTMIGELLARPDAAPRRAASSRRSSRSSRRQTVTA